MNQQIDPQKLTAWQQQGQALNALIVGSDRKEPAQVFVKSWSKGEIAKRAFKAWGFWWLLAAVSIFIPLLHFVLVPLFLLIGLVAPLLVSVQKTVVLGGQGTCPFCSETFEIIKCSDRWPLHDVCGACRRHVTIEKCAH